MTDTKNETTATDTKTPAKKGTSRRATPSKAARAKKAAAAKAAKATAAEAATKAPAKKKPTKAKAPTKAKGAAKPKEVKPTAAPTPVAAPAADAARPADGFTQRQITNAIKGLKSEERIEMHQAILGVDVPRNKAGKVTMTVVKLSGILAKAIKAGDGALPDLVAAAMKPRRERKEKGPVTPKRVDRIVDMLREGATVKAISEMLVVEFPERRDGRKATAEWYCSYIRNCIRCLAKGTSKKYAGSAGNVADLGDGVWKMTA